MRVVLVGAGRLATQLGLALREAGHDILAVYSYHLSSAVTLAEQIGSTATDDIDALPLEADVYVISVKDAVLKSVIAQLAEGRRSQTMVHTAGSMSQTLFDGYVKHYGVLYPMQSFSKEYRVNFRVIPIFLEASDTKTLAMLHELSESISQSVHELTTADRKYLHLAAVFACNFANHCYVLAAEVLERKGLPFSVMLPLIDETARKVHLQHPLNAQTGPAIRYDENVIGMQSELLSAFPDIQRLYILLSQSIHDRSEMNGIR